MNLGRVVTALLFAILPTIASSAGGVDPTLVGAWSTPTRDSNEQRARAHRWHITATGESTLSTIMAETGFLTTNPESWAVRSPNSPYDISLGIYQVEGPDSFSTVIAGLPFEWITWTRVPQGEKPQGVDACLLGDIMSETSGEAPQTSFNPGFVGFWQAVMTKSDGSRAYMVWRIHPDGRSTFISVTQTQTLFLESNDGYLKITPTDGPVEESTYRLINPQAFEMSGPNMTATWTRCGQ